MNLARHYKHIILMLFALCLLLVSCRGVGGAGLSKSAVFASAYRSLRIGQVQTANNRVAITLAIDSREVLVIMSPDPSSPSLSDVLYRTPEGTIVQIRIDTRGLPRTAVSDSGSISFTNYTPFTFDFEIMINGESLALSDKDKSLRLSTAEISEEVQELLRQVNPLTPNNDPSLTDFRNNFIIGIIATNIFGCSPTNLEQEVIQNTELATLPPQVCNSLLIRTMRNVLKLNDFENRVVEQFIGDPIGCAFPENNFERAKECIENSSGEIIKEALLAAPNLETVINGTFDPETGEILPPPPTPTPTPRPKPSPTPKPGELPPAPIEPPIEPKPTPTPTPTPPPSVPPAFFFGSYQGSFTDTTDYSLVMAFCPNDADIQINISSGTDLSCTSPNCDINGSITFFYDSTPITSSLTGTINENGLGVASLQVQDPNIPVFDVFDFKFSAMQSSMNFFNADYHSSQGCEGSANLFENVPK